MNLLIHCEACGGDGGHYDPDSYWDRCLACDGFGSLIETVDDAAGITVLSLKDDRPVREQKAAWDEFRKRLAEWSNP